MDILAVALRTSIAFLVLLVLTRFLGRREIAQLTFFDFVSAITMGSVAASTLIDREMSIPAGIAALFVWSGWIYLSSYISQKSIPARKLLEGEPLLVMHNGKILEQNLAKAHYNVHDLLTQLRAKNIFDPIEVELGILEPDGKLSVQKKPEYNPVTLKSLNIPAPSTASANVGDELIADGKVIHENLHIVGITEERLYQELRQQGIADLQEVVLAIMRPNGSLYVDRKKDHR